jgi:hypothetical protein
MKLYLDKPSTSGLCFWVFPLLLATTKKLRWSQIRVKTSKNEPDPT